MSPSSLRRGRTFAAAALFLAAPASTSFAQCPADDATTTNNDCASAAPGTVGTVTGLSVQGGVEDFWSYTVPAGQTLNVDCLFVDATADVDVNLFVDGACASTYDTSVTTSDDENVFVDNFGAGPLNVVVRVFIWQNPAGSCNDYSLVTTLAPPVTPSACVGLPDDAQEPNDTCGAAVAPASNPLTGMFVSKIDPDHFVISVPAGNILTVDATFSDAAGNVNLAIIDAACTTVLDTSNTTSDNESASATNLTGAAVNMVVQVSHLSTDTASDCNTYDLTWSFTPDPCFAGTDDAEEQNDTCATATVASSQALTGLFVSLGDEDFYSITLQPFDTLDVRLDYINDNGDVDAQIIDTADCSTVLEDSNFSFSDFEDVTYKNNTGAAQTVALRVHIDIVTNIDISCNNYDMAYTITPDPCIGSVDDGEEDNDTCVTAVVPSANPLAGLFVSLGDDDFYTISVPVGDILNVDVLFADSFGDVEIELTDSTCATSLDTGLTASDNEQVTWTNDTGAAANVTLRVFMDPNDASSCNNYDLAWSTTPDPCLLGMDDMFEENDDCSAAVPVTVGNYPNLFCRKETNGDQDWYSIDVPDQATIVVLLTHVEAIGDIDGDMVEVCGGATLDVAFTLNDVEDMTWTNNTGATVNVKWGAWVWDSDADFDCNTYDMNVDIQGGVPSNIIPYCFGDGSGTPCPCGNNSTSGHLGGCANSAGNGAILVATGSPTVGADTLNFDLSFGTPTSFALLVSGVNQLPQVGGCIGCGLPVFDGLRCAGGGFLRHGSRAIDGSGNVGNGWGPPGGPAGGLIAANGFLAGQTRNFFAFYRENPANVCQTGQNSSNGIQVMFN